MRKRPNTLELSPVAVMTRASYMMILRLSGILGEKNPTVWPTPRDIINVSDRAEECEPSRANAQMNTSLFKDTVAALDFENRNGWYWLRGKVPQYFDEFIKSNGIAGTAFFPPGPTSQAPLAITAPISPSTSRGVKQTKKIEPKTNITTAQTL